MPSVAALARGRPGGAEPVARTGVEDRVDYPALQAFHGRMRERPSVARAFAEERPLYQADQPRAD